MSNLLISAQLFYADYLEALDRPKARTSEGEKLYLLRKTCAAGFMALDSALSLYWKEIVLPEWTGILGLCEDLISDDKAQEEILKSLGGALHKGQLMASLRFLENTGDPERFSPNLIDCGLVLVLLQDRGHKLPYIEMGQKLCRMQRLRNSVFHSGKNFSEIEAAASVKEINDFFALSQKLSPIFRDAFTLKKPLQKAA
jgi:hypothetical protein